MTRLPPGKKDIKPIDWGRVFAKLMVDGNMSYESILDRTFPQIEALISSLNYSGGDDDKEEHDPDEEHSIMDGQAFAALFAGIG